MDSAGNLYGTTKFDETNNDGTVYEILAGTHPLNTIAVIAGNPYQTVQRLKLRQFMRGTILRIFRGQGSVRPEGHELIGPD